MTIQEAQSIVDNEAMPETTRQKARDFITRMTRKTSTSSPMKVPTQVPTQEEMAAGFQALAALEQKMKVEKAEAKQVEEIKQAVVSAQPEPAPRQQGSKWNIAGIEYTYLSFDAKTEMHFLTPVRQTTLLPETISVSEERLVGKKFAQGPRRTNCETPEQVQARRRREQADEYRRTGWSRSMFSDDPEGVW